MRGVICYFMRKKFQLSLTSIAEHLNLSNHTSILHALNNVNNMIDVKDEIFMKYFEPINKMLHEAQ